MKNIEGLHKKTVIFTLIAAVVYLAFFFFLDRSIDLWIHNNYAETWLHYLGFYISYSVYDPFIKVGLAFCFVLIFVIDPGIKKRWVRSLFYICVSVSIVIIIGDGLKFILGRYRPVMLFENNLYGLTLFSTEWALNSSPSGHTFRAFALMTALSLLYRKFAVVFISIAVLIGLSRVVVTAHYPSDVLFGAFIGVITSVWTYYYFIQKPQDSSVGKVLS